ncbi:hypothetical protein [Streptomyces sp. Root264]|uniref:hypothetical protein n=1 Tax=Streptomyces sp. Root264 TaxID=1736503 RepID=UPI0012FF3793|nr:hypothetical protein [Streptomyces sp. Root264]
MVELDRRTVDAALDAVRPVGLTRIEALAADAPLLDHRAGITPADIVLLCGVFGNITDSDIERTGDACTRLCATGGRVIRTGKRKAPDRMPLICGSSGRAASGASGSPARSSPRPWACTASAGGPGPLGRASTPSLSLARVPWPAAPWPALSEPSAL